LKALNLEIIFVVITSLDSNFEP